MINGVEGSIEHAQADILPHYGKTLPSTKYTYNQVKWLILIFSEFLNGMTIFHCFMHPRNSSTDIGHLSWAAHLYGSPWELHMNNDFHVNVCLELTTHAIIHVRSGSNDQNAHCLRPRSVTFPIVCLISWQNCKFLFFIHESLDSGVTSQSEDCKFSYR